MSGEADPALRTLRAIPLRVAYDTDEHDVLREFYNPALAAAVTYNRLAGFFSSSALSSAARGIAGLVRNGGRMRLIASPHLTEEDVRAIELGEATATEAAERAALRSLESIETLLQEDEREALALLIASGHLEIRLALPLGSKGNPLPANQSMGSILFHQKVGILADAQGDAISYSGSINETLSGWTRNIEEFKVFRSWVPGESAHLESDQQKFEKYWEGRSKNTIVIPVSAAVQRKLIEYLPLPRTALAKNEEVESTLWPHQITAVSAFLSAKAGILEMATGTGKTRTALHIARHLMKAGDVDSVIIATVGNDLLKQWCSELLSFFGDTNILVKREFEDRHEGRAFLLHAGTLPSALVVSYENLAKLFPLDRQQRFGRALLICDEIHNMGSALRAASLAGKFTTIPWRLGLSATPEREYDPEGTGFIQREVGPVLYQFGLADAIRAGILCEFDYEPLLYELTDDDRAKIPQAYARHAARKRQNTNASPNELYRDLADIRKESKAKLPIFARFVAEHPEVLDRCVIFVATIEYGHDVQTILHNYTRRYHTYYSDDDDDNLKRFARGELSTLVTCKRISEGIDIRSIRNIILFASDRTKLQTIQRIGRCLRKDPEDPTKRSHVLDFVLQDDVRPSEAATPEGPGARVPVDAERYNWLTALATTKVDK